jgi:hypothetical protein
MFESLTDQMKQDDRQQVRTSERIIRWAVVTVLSVLLFGGLYFGIRLVG